MSFSRQMHFVRSKLRNSFISKSPILIDRKSSIESSISFILIKRCHINQDYIAWLHSCHNRRRIVIRLSRSENSHSCDHNLFTYANSFKRIENNLTIRALYPSINNWRDLYFSIIFCPYLLLSDSARLRQLEIWCRSLYYFDARYLEKSQSRDIMCGIVLKRR